MIDYKVLADGYGVLLEEYKRKDLAKAERLFSVLKAKMSLLDMDMEISLYERKHGETVRTIEKKARNQSILDVLDCLGELQEDNYSLILIAGIAQRERDFYRKKVEFLENKIKQIERFNS